MFLPGLLFGSRGHRPPLGNPGLAGAVDAGGLSGISVLGNLDGPTCAHLCPPVPNGDQRHGEAIASPERLIYPRPSEHLLRS